MFKVKTIEPKHKEDLINKAVEFLELKENWDSYGANIISEEAVYGVKFFVESFLFHPLIPLPDIFPVPNGNIQLEWSIYDLDIEIEIHSVNEHNILFEDLLWSINSFEKENASFEDIQKVIDVLYLKSQHKRYRI